MGICGLLRFMKPFTEPINIKKYAGKRVGIDVYSWLHKGAYSCSLEICLNSDGDKKLQYLQYCMHRINMLRHYQITPVVVFDGASIPCKSGTEQERHIKRKANLDLAMAKFKEGDGAAASELFQRAVSITPSMAHQLIRILRAENIEFIVAPYEADAQLAYLSNLEADKGGIAAVITEDSDLLAYGCNAVVFKMDRHGNGEEILLDKPFASEGPKYSLKNFDQELFRGMCVLAGCDFLPSIPGIGIIRSYSLVAKYRNLDRVLSVLKFEKCKVMPEDYLNSFREAIAVFEHARIYDVDTKRLKHLKPLPPNLLEALDGELDFLGPYQLNSLDEVRLLTRELPPSVAIAIAEGNLDPSTMEAFNHIPMSTKFHLDPITTEASGPLEIPDSAELPSEKIGFRILPSSLRRIHKRNRVSEEKTVLDEKKYSKEAAALTKIVSLMDEHPINTASNTVNLDEMPLKIPDNNPFKKRKCSQDDHLDLHRTESNDTPLKIPDNNPFEKRKWSQEYIDLDQTECNDEQLSVVTQVESNNDELTYVAFDSQESISSKLYTIVDENKASRNVKKAKKNVWKSCQSKRNSILNFFSHV